MPWKWNSEGRVSGNWPGSAPSAPLPAPSTATALRCPPPPHPRTALSFRVLPLPSDPGRKVTQQSGPRLSWWSGGVFLCWKSHGGLGAYRSPGRRENWPRVCAGEGASGGVCAPACSPAKGSRCSSLPEILCVLADGKEKDAGSQLTSGQFVRRGHVPARL